MTIQEGDVVTLRAGGPRMNVEGIMGDIVKTVWFEKEPSGTWSGPHRNYFYNRDLVVWTTREGVSK